MSDTDEPGTQQIRERLPDEVYAAEADYVQLAMKTMTARRMIGWLRAFAEYAELAGNYASAEHAWHVSNRLAREVETESVVERKFGEEDEDDD